jgi:putative ABC transport system substrate-binding protein
MSAMLPLVLSITLLAFAEGVSNAQQPPSKIPRIGWISLASRAGPDVAAFLEGLRERAYIEGRDIIIEYRFADRREDRLPKFAAELVRLKVDAIVAISNAATHAAREATTTIPIVFVYGDPIGDGIAASLARPGGNITGLSFFSLELSGKRLELLKETVPKITRAAVLYDLDGQTHTRQLKEMQVAAQALGVQLQALEVRYPEPDFERLFQAAISQRANALLTLPDPRVFFYRRRVSDLAVKSRLPAMYPSRPYVEVGGLMSYGPSLPDLYRRAAFYVDKILKGAKPADLPVEQPTKFELVINLKTAKEIGVTIHPEVLIWADKVIR